MSKVDKETLQAIRCNTACDTCHVWCHENCVTHLDDLTRDSMLQNTNVIRRYSKIYYPNRLKRDSYND